MPLPSTRRTLAAASAAVLALAATPVGVIAQVSPAQVSPHAAGLMQSSVPLGGAPRPVSIARGASFAVDLPTDARDVIIADPRVAEAMLHSSRRITIIGVAAGQTDAVFLDAAGRPILSLKIRVDAGVSALQDTISRVVPGAQVTAEAVNDTVILTGLVSSPAEADRVARVAAAYVSAPEKVLNMISVAGSDQVTLKVRVIEVQRTAIKQLGFNSDVMFGRGSESISFGRAGTYGVNGSLIGGGGACYGQNAGRTTTNRNTNTTNNQITSGSTTNNSTSNTTNNNSSNTITNTTTNNSGTTLTTSDGRNITFIGGAPGTIQVTDFEGNVVTLTGQTAADYLRSTVSGTSLSNAVSGVLGSSVASSIISVIGSTVASNSGNLLTNTVENVVSSVFDTVTGNNASACLAAFERVGLVRTLAEPNVTAVNGETSSFLAGGEFPVPTGRDRDGNITVEYKPYGVSLSFRPIVLTGGRISLQLKVEVSELTNQGGFTVGAGTPTALTLQGLQVRRSENTIELPSGGAMMISGLLQESTRQAIDGLPGMTAMPVLGQLFRSRDYLNGETELVIIVEPYLVTATSPGQMQTPADGLRIASDIQTTLFGQLNQAYGTPAPVAAGAGWQGPVGYVID